MLATVTSAAIAVVAQTLALWGGSLAMAKAGFLTAGLGFKASIILAIGSSLVSLLVSWLFGQALSMIAAPARVPAPGTP